MKSPGGGEAEGQGVHPFGVRLKRGYKAGKNGGVSAISHLVTYLAFYESLPNLVSMNARSLLFLMVTVLVAGFTALNWSLFTEPAPLSLGWLEFEAPPGLILLVFNLFVAAAMVSYINHLKKAALIQAGHSAKELQNQRILADSAEASRFTELKQFLTLKFNQSKEDEAKSRQELESRFKMLEERLAAMTRSAAGSTPAPSSLVRR